MFKTYLIILLMLTNLVSFAVSFYISQLYLKADILRATAEFNLKECKEDLFTAKELCKCVKEEPQKRR